jgi:hypothetical protein
MSSQPKSRSVSFSDDDDKIILIPLRTVSEKKELFYSGDDIKRMKDAALLEHTGVTEADISTKGQDMFEVRQSLFKRESLQRVAREHSPMRSPVSGKQPVKQVDLGDSLFTNLAETETKPEPKKQEEKEARPVRERRPRGEERGVRRCKSGMGPNRTDSLATRTNEGRTLRRGVPQRARSSMQTGAGEGLSDLAKMQAAARKIGASKPAS